MRASLAKVQHVVAGGFEWVGSHARIILTALSFLFVALAIFAYSGWKKATDAQQRVTSIETQRRQEKAAADAAKRTAEVALCFSSARNRPRLVLVLNAINGTTQDKLTREAIHDLIHEYESQPTQGIEGIPTRDKCAARAKELGVDFKTFDFDPATGDLINAPEQR